VTSGLSAAVPATGANNNYTASGQMTSSIAFVDLTPGGNCNITGLLSGADGQIITITNLSGTFTVTLNALNSGSLSANQFRLAADLTLTQYQHQSFRYSISIGKWIAL
jgi:hypothetical protein